MNDLKILKGGQLVRTDWDAIVKVKKTINVESVLPYLCCECELESGVKFADLLTLIRKDCDLLSYLLTSGPWLKEIIEEGDKPYVRDDDSVSSLEVYWAAEVSDYNDADELDEYTSIHGLGGAEGPYALDFAPINTLTELEVKLNTEYKVYDVRDGLVDAPVLVSAQKQFKLLDILRGVFWELSFHGSIKNRDERVASIKQSIADIDSGLVKTIPWTNWDDMMAHKECAQCKGEGWVVDGERRTCVWCGGNGIEPSSMKVEMPDRDREEDLNLEED
jgi:hypothetical protein